MQKVAILGSGTVGDTLAGGFLKHGYAVMRGSREPAKMASWLASAGPNAAIGTFAEAAAWGDLAVLAVKGSAAVDVIKLAGPDNLAGKLVLDTTNPIADKPPVHGVLSYFTTYDDSLIERIQAAAPKAHLVKCFSSVGSVMMINPRLSETPSMFICGNDAAAKVATGEILTKFGWETIDLGAVEAGRAIEPLCILWCVPGLTKNSWTHAFKMLEMKPA